MDKRNSDIRRRTRIVLAGLAVLLFSNIQLYLEHSPAFGCSLWIFVKLCAGPFWSGKAVYIPDAIGVFRGFEPATWDVHLGGIIFGILIVAAQFLYVFFGGRILYFLSAFGLLIWLSSTILQTFGSP